MFLGVLGVGIAGVVVGAAAVRGVGGVVGFVAAGAGAAAAAIALVARSLSSWTVAQLVMSASPGIKTIVVLTAQLPLMMTTLACGPIPRRHATVAIGRDLVPQNLAQL